jgi:hypothetical protein
VAALAESEMNNSRKVENSSILVIGGAGYIGVTW